MKQNEEHSDLDATFERLRRESFEAVVELACEGILLNLNPAERLEVVVDWWSSDNCRGPSSDWIERYKGMGWEWNELTEEAHRRRDIREAEEGSLY